MNTEASPGSAEAAGAAQAPAALLKELIDHVDAMLAYWNQDQVCLLANAAYLHWFGKTKQEVVGMTMRQLLGPLYEKNLPYIEAAFAGRKQVFEREIPLPDGSVDVLWCERVLQHVPDAGAAIAEFARVLRPGGRALLLDSDHDSRVESDVDPAVSRAMTTAFMGQLANPTAARHIPRQAIEAGLHVDPDVGSSALVYPQEVLRDSHLSRLSAEQAVADGLITQEQADRALAAQADAARQGWAFWAVTVFGFVCRKD